MVNIQMWLATALSLILGSMQSILNLVLVLNRLQVTTENVDLVEFVLALCVCSLL